ncbi:SusC/RagA family TonB-linked outer membrane protein [Pontibacter beigongshangensis]|uniref:SusC/RagA family TonB-linked outer membrane protein n=1 Tax=Pontibacter beigongshangensis TaxID=2574733 RepID=UPI00164F3DD4|nr:TonB-dependent receptor [Pontibacter beigongshangensis]
MKKVLLLKLALLLCLLQQAVAQDRTVTGTVTEQATAKALPGVSVSVKGAATGTSTDQEGRFSLGVPANSATENLTLIFSLMGMVAQEVVVGDSTVLAIALAADAKQLSEIVVTGYQTQNRREVTGSVATVAGQEVALNPFGSFEQALQGRATGMLVQANSGQPGATASVLIRGRGSVFGGTQPLFILDGVEISATDFSTLNHADFASYTILKDAISTSQYGSRGANGVVVITTKKGVEGPTLLDYHVQYGFSTMPENRHRVMNSQEKLAYELANGNPYGWDADDIARLSAINTSWEKELFRTGLTKNHTLTASGGNNKTTYLLSGSIFDQEGTVRNTGLDRYTGRANIESRAGDFTFGLNSTFGYSELANTYEATTSTNVPLNAIRWSNPYEPPYDQNGNYNQPVASWQPNALELIYENTSLRQQLKGVGNVYVAYNVPFLPGLSFRTSWGGDYFSNETSELLDPTTAPGRGVPGGKGQYSRGYNRFFGYTGTTSASYDRRFGSDHTLQVSMFNEIVKGGGKNFGFTGYGLGGPFENEAGITPGTATNGFIPAVNGGGNEQALLSYFTMVHYGYKNRYFVSATGRRDGSSRFGLNHQWANFGSAGVSWVVSEEAFMEALTGVFNELKFKASYGTSGNQAGLGDFQSRELYGRAVYNGVSGLQQVQLENEQLKWERRTTFNTGLELATLQGRLRATIEYYHALTSDLFLNRQLSRTTGYTNLVSNVGTLQNSGVEFSLDGDLIKTQDFTWSANLNLTHNRNRINKLVGEGDNDIISGVYMNREGEALNSFYVVRYAGVNPDNGNAQYLNLNGDLTEVYNPADRVLVGSAEVPFFGGFGTSLQYKGFALSTFFTFVQGNKIYNEDRTNIENPSFVWDNLAAAMLDEWREPGQVTAIPRASQVLRTGTTRFIEEGDFLRWRNLMVSYTLPGNVLKAARLRHVSVFAQGQNLATFTKFLGFDPEVSTPALTGARSRVPGQLSGAQYPALRTITFGISVGL